MDRFSADPAVIERREWYAKMQTGFYKQREQVDNLREQSLSRQDLHFGTEIIDKPTRPIMTIDASRKRLATTSEIIDSKWIIQLFSSQPSSASHEMRTTIICFPGAGCNHSSFSNLTRRIIAEHIAVVYSTCLPGRMHRLKETWSGSPLRKIVNVIQQEMLQMGLISKETNETNRVIFIGHDVGALIAYELLRSFTRDGIVIAGLIVLSMRSPLTQTHSNFERKAEIENKDSDEGASRVSGDTHHTHSRQDSARSNLSAADDKASHHSQYTKSSKGIKHSYTGTDDKGVEAEEASTSVDPPPKALLPPFKTLTNKQLLNSIAQMGGIPSLLHERKDIMRKLVLNFRTDATLLDDYCISAPSFPGLPYYEPEGMTEDDIHEILEMPPQLFKMHIPIFTIYGANDIWFDENEVLAWGLASNEHDHFLVEDCGHYQLLQSSQVHEIVVNMIARMQAVPDETAEEEDHAQAKDEKSEGSFS